MFLRKILVGSLNKILVFRYNKVILVGLIKIFWVDQKEFISPLPYTINEFLLKRAKLPRLKTKTSENKNVEQILETSNARCELFFCSMVSINRLFQRYLANVQTNETS